MHGVESLEIIFKVKKKGYMFPQGQPPSPNEKYGCAPGLKLAYSTGLARPIKFHCTG